MRQVNGSARISPSDCWSGSAATTIGSVADVNGVATFGEAALAFFLAAHFAPAALAQVPSPFASISPFSSASGDQPPAPWRVVGVPGGKIPLTTYVIADIDGSRALRVEANKSYGNLVHPITSVSPEAGVRLRWRWRLEEPLRSADLRQRSGDDSPLKVCALFDMPLEKLGVVDRSLLRMARSATGEKLPSATLCYVWDHALATGTLVRNAYSGRVRMIVVNSGDQRLGQWLNHDRDLAADFQRAFGEESDVMPPLQAVLVGADADNTGGRSLGWVGNVSFSP